MRLVLKKKSASLNLSPLWCEISKKYPIVILPCFRRNSQLQTMWCLTIWCPILPIQLNCGFSFYLGLFGLVEDFTVSDQWKLERCVLELLISFFTTCLGKNLIVYVVGHLNPCYFLYIFICWHEDAIML